jgi:hypothetical protein
MGISGGGCSRAKPVSFGITGQNTGEDEELGTKMWVRLKKRNIRADF